LSVVWNICPVEFAVHAAIVITPLTKIVRVEFSLFAANPGNFTISIFYRMGTRSPAVTDIICTTEAVIRAGCATGSIPASTINAIIIAGSCTSRALINIDKITGAEI